MTTHQDNNSRSALYRLFTFYSAFFILGILVAYWFGLGWFFLFHAVRGLFSSVQLLSVPTMRILAGTHYADELEKKHQLKSPAYRFLSTVVVNTINFGLATYFFWKANIPIAELLRLANS